MPRAHSPVFGVATTNGTGQRRYFVKLVDKGGNLYQRSITLSDDTLNAGVPTVGSLWRGSLWGREKELYPPILPSTICQWMGI
jgi:hypothetical protein